MFCYLSIVLLVVVIRMLFHNTVLGLAFYGFKDGVLMHVNWLDIVLVIVGVIEGVVCLVVTVVHDLTVRILLVMLHDRLGMTFNYSMLNYLTMWILLVVLHDRLGMTLNDFRLSMKEDRLRQVLRKISV